MKTFAAALPLCLVFSLSSLAYGQKTTDDEDDAQADPKAMKEKDKKAKKDKKGKKDPKEKKEKGKKGDDKAGATVGAEAGADFAAGGEVAGGVESTGTLSDTGEEENPNAPTTGETRATVSTTAVALPVERAPYPLEYVQRPLVLSRRLTEASLELPNSFNSYVQNGVLAARHGVTDELQLGLRYGMFSFVAVDGESETFGGKTFAIEAQYKVFEWLAPHISVPMLVDPFSSAVSFGPHMQFTFFDKLKIFGGRDLFTIRINRLIPSVNSPVETAGFVALDATETDLPSGEFNLNGGVAYQYMPNMAIEGRVGVRTFFDSNTDSTDRDPLLFDLGLIYSSSNMIDIGGRLGWSDVNRADESFGLWVFGAFRI